VRRALLLPVALSIVVTTAGIASAQQGSPVEGGGSFNDAPLLTEARYSDTIRAGETLYYAIDLAAGQRLVARATIRKGVGRFGTSISDFAEMVIVEPDRNEHALSGAKDSDDLFRYPFTLSTRTGVVGEPLTLSDASPGTWFVTLNMPRSRAIRRGELNVALTLDVRGQAVSSPTPTETPSPTPTPDATEEEEEGGTGAPPPSDPAGDYTGLFLAMFLLGVVGGSALEIVRSGRAGGRA
jgi:hypothetical protein